MTDICRSFGISARAARIGVAAAIALGAIASHEAQAQVPKTIRILVPFPAGGPTDTVARVVSEQIGKQHNVTFVIENRVGGGSAIATEAAARATPDGSTLLITAGALLINPILKKMNYDPITSFEPLCKLVRSPHFIVVNKDSPLKSFGDLVAAAKAKPGELTFATVGPATGPHIAFETLKRRIGADIRFVPYPGTTPSINAVLGGHVAVAMGDFRDVIGPLQGGLLRGLAATTASRIEQLPDVPTVAEQGYPGFDAESWFGLVTPAGTPKETVSQLTAWVSAALKDPEVRTRLTGAGLFPTGLCGADFAAHLRQQYENYVREIREAGIKAQ
jgi:tripartite-type tricarboxylate transporter receptor subunit TctC